MNVIFILVLYVIIVNIAGFAEMGIDKRRARKGAFRIPEANLFLHPRFVIGMPAILLIQLAAAAYLLFAAPVQFTLM